MRLNQLRKDKQENGGWEGNKAIVEASCHGKQFLLEQLLKDKPKNSVEASSRGKHSGLDCLPSARNRSAWKDIKVLIFGIFCVF